VANFAGLAASEWSWQPLFIDIDLDGYEDVFISNGYGRDMLDADIGREAQALAVMSAEERQKIAGMYPVLNVPKVAFRNRGDLTFEEKGAEWGLGTPGVGHGVAEADLDNDGDLDLVMNMYRDYPAVYRNNAPSPRVAVRLRGRGGNWQGIGAKVTLRGGALPAQTREVFCGGRYHSGGDPQLCFAAGKKPGVMKLEVLWRNGARSDVDNVGADRIYEISEPALPND
jgi:hypothetical protein